MTFLKLTFNKILEGSDNAVLFNAENITCVLDTVDGPLVSTGENSFYVKESFDDIMNMLAQADVIMTVDSVRKTMIND